MKNSVIVPVNTTSLFYTATWATTNEVQCFFCYMNIFFCLSQNIAMGSGLNVGENSTLRLRDHANNNRQLIRLSGHNHVRHGKAKPNDNDG